MWPFTSKKTETKTEEPKKTKYHLPFTQNIIDEFNKGKITHHNLNVNGISDISVKVNGINVRVSFYSAGILNHELLSIKVGGDSYPTASSKDAEAIRKAAVGRSYRLLDEKIAELSQKMGITTSV